MVREWIDVFFNVTIVMQESKNVVKLDCQWHLPPSNCLLVNTYVAIGTNGNSMEIIFHDSMDQPTTLATKEL